jgi:hypothetical protein
MIAAASDARLGDPREMRAAGRGNALLNARAKRWMR